MYRFIISLLLFGLTASLGAQETLTLEKCREMALNNNKQVAISSASIDKAELDLKTYKANFYPKISAKGYYLYTTSDISHKIDGGYLPTFLFDPATGGLVPNLIDGSTTVFKEYAFMPDIPFNFNVGNTYLANLSLEQPIYMGGKIKAAYNMANIGVEMYRLKKTLTNSEIIIESDKAYWNCIKAREMITAMEKYKEVVEELYRVVSNATNAGMSQKGDVLKVQVKRNEVELNLQKAKNGLSLATMNLCYVTGLPLNSNITVENASNPSALLSLTQDYNVENRAEYKILSQQVELKAEQQKLAMSDYLPNVGLSASYGYINGIELNDQKLINHAGFSAIVAVNIPIFHWGEGRNKVASAEKEKVLAQLELEDVTNKMQLEISQARNTLNENLLEVEMTQTALAQAEENLRMSKNQYDVGMETLADYLEAQTLWQKAWADKIEAEASYHMSESSYLKAIGQL